MNPAPPLLCGTLLAAMLAAGVSHYWSVHEFIAGYPTVPAVRLISGNLPETEQTKPSEARTTPNLAAVDPTGNSSELKSIFEEMLSELKKIKNEKNDLIDQLAETNRSVMQLQFQVDSHSEDFRPMPTREEREDTSYGMEDESPGVLPPRAHPVQPINP